jgi:hypothetical protein
MARRNYATVDCLASSELLFDLRIEKFKGAGETKRLGRCSAGDCAADDMLMPQQLPAQGPSTSMAMNSSKE